MIVIGDSHISMFKNTKAYHFQNRPHTACMLHNYHKELLKILNRHKKETILFIFGEVDCRIHVFNTMKTLDRDYDIVIEDIVENYLEYVRMLIEYYGFDVRVLTIPPAGCQDNYYNLKYYASYDLRKIFNYYFNYCLIKSNLTMPYNPLPCTVPIINYVKYVVDPFGRKKDYILDEVHLNNKVEPIILGLL